MQKKITENWYRQTNVPDIGHRNFTHQADGTTDYAEVQGNVVFNDVDFGYTDDKIVLHNIKLFAEPGQKIAFVGSTGAGKTTITNRFNPFL